MRNRRINEDSWGCRRRKTCCRSRRSANCATAFLILLVTPAAILRAGEPQEKATPQTDRVLYVPFEDLPLVLGGPNERVFLQRSEYEELLRRAKKQPANGAPRQAWLSAARYTMTLEGPVAEIRGELEVEVLKPGWHRVPLGVSDVRILRAELDGKPAPLGPDGSLFVQGIGRRKLTLQLQTDVAVSAAVQMLTFRLPSSAAASLEVQVPGNVDIKRGAEVIERTYDTQQDRTHFELVVPRQLMRLAITVNNRRLRTQRFVVARSVNISQLAPQHEQWQSAVSLDVLHGAADRFVFEVDGGLQITAVQSPRMTQWLLREEEGKTLLEVRLREAVQDLEVIRVWGTRPFDPTQTWEAPRLRPQGTASHITVVGITAVESLKLKELRRHQLVWLNQDLLGRIAAASRDRPRGGTDRFRPVAVLFAPTDDYRLEAVFGRPPTRLDASVHLMWRLEESRFDLWGGFTVTAKGAPAGGFSFRLPRGWSLTELTDDRNRPLAYDRFVVGNEQRFVVNWDRVLAVGEQRVAVFHATRVDPRWFDPFEELELEFPRVVLEGAVVRRGALAVAAHADIVIRPGKAQGLRALDASDRSQYGLDERAGDLAYAIVSHPYAATFHVRRRAPQWNARSYAFFKIDDHLLKARYEMLVDVTRSRTDRIEFSLPASTPTALKIDTANGAAKAERRVLLRETQSHVAGDRRIWTVHLSEPTRGLVRLLISFEQAIDTERKQTITLPMLACVGSRYQTDLVALEGSPTLEIVAQTKMRSVDVGELAEATYVPDRHLVGVFASTPRARQLDIVVQPRQLAWLPAAIVRRAEIVTVVSPHGVAQSAARYRLATKAPRLAIDLPAESSLWSITQNDQPIQPSRRGSRVVVNLREAGRGEEIDLRLVYETVIGPLGARGAIDMSAPRLQLLGGAQESESQNGATQERASRSGGVVVPQVDLVWHLHLPGGYRVVRSNGTVFTDQLPRPMFPFEQTWRALDTLAGGLLFSPMPMQAAREAAGRAEMDMAAPHGSVAGEELADVPLAEADEFGGIGGGGFGGMGEDKSMAGPGAGPPQESRMSGAGVPKTAASPPGRSSRVKSEAKDESTLRLPAVKKNKAKYAYWALKGLRGVNVELKSDQTAVEFGSLGEAPHLRAKVVDGGRISWLALAVAALVFAYGMTLIRQSVYRKLRWVAIVWTVGLLLASVGGETSAYNDVFALSAVAATLLVPVWCVWRGLAVLVQWAAEAAGWLKARAVRALARSAAVLLPALLVWACLGELPSVAQESPDRSPPSATDDDDLAPLRIPDDAILIPYDPNKPESRRESKRVLVPYQRYVELWNRAHPQQPMGTTKTPVDFALSGAAYQLTLGDADHLQVTGEVMIEVLADKDVDVPLSLHGAVIRRAQLDGKPAVLRSVTPAPAPVRQTSSNDRPQLPLVVIRVSGTGPHRLELTLEIPIQRRGGWRFVDAVIPHGAAASAEVTVPVAHTRLRRSLAATGFAVETRGDRERLNWPLLDGGKLAIAWRPRTMPGSVDRSLTARSRALVDLVGEGIRVAWRVELAFGVQERGGFEFVVPAGYRVERVTGNNVRGWNVETQGERRLLQVELLKGAKQSETLDVFLYRRQPLIVEQEVAVAVPYLQLVDASLHRGTIAVRKTPVLDLRVTVSEGTSRVDRPTGSELAQELKPSVPSPVGIEEFRTFAFRTTPFQLELSVRHRPVELSAEWRTLLRVGTTETGLESQVVMLSRGGVVHELELDLPAELELKNIAAPFLSEWDSTRAGERQRVRLYFSQGQTGRFALTLVGRLPDHQPDSQIALPLLQAVGVVRQNGTLVIQADSSLDVEPRQLDGLQTRLLDTVDWLAAVQRESARLVWAFSQLPYRGDLKLTPRRPEIRCDTITNVRVTYRRVEETILLDFEIRRAGTRQIVFELPRSLVEAEITAPMIRRKQVTPLDDERIRVTLELQDAVMGEYRVMVGHDRGLTDGVQPVPVPVVRSGKTTYRYVTFENDGRDELEVQAASDFQVLQRGTSAWNRLRERLGGSSLTLAYVTTGAQPTTTLGFSLRRREAIKTAGANIGLARTTLVLDGSGAYRAVMELRVDNRTESVLEVELPEGASLWAALVAGEPVKPIRPTGRRQGRRLQIPLVKTAEGDLDYIVQLKYAGQMAAPRTGKSVVFPFLRTVNIQIELSQVELRLPRHLNWVYFGGTASRVENRDDFLAGYLAYRQRQLETLSQVLRRKNWFSSMRALYNVKSLASELSSLQQKTRSKRNRSQQTLLDESQSMARQLLEQAETQVDMSTGEAGLAVGNRAKLDRLLQSQRNDVSANEVVRLGDNFAAPQAETPSAGQSIAGGANRWLEQNQLARANEPEATPSESSKRPGDDKRKAEKKDAEQLQRQVAGDRQVAEGVFKRGQAEQTVRPQAGRTGEMAQQADAAKLKAAFTQKLQQQAGLRPSDATIVGGDEDEREEAAKDGGRATTTGLASLDFDLPSKGQAFYFVMPRGDVEITARAVPVDWAYRGISWRSSAALLLPMWFVVLIVARWRPGRTLLTVIASLLFIFSGFAFLMMMPLAFVFLVLCAMPLVDRLRRRS